MHLNYQPFILHKNGQLIYAWGPSKAVLKHVRRLTADQKNDPTSPELGTKPVVIDSLVWPEMRLCEPQSIWRVVVGRGGLAPQAKADLVSMVIPSGKGKASGNEKQPLEPAKTENKNSLTPEAQKQPLPPDAAGKTVQTPPAAGAPETKKTEEKKSVYSGAKIYGSSSKTGSGTVIKTAGAA